MTRFIESGNAILLLINPPAPFNVAHSVISVSDVLEEILDRLPISGKAACACVSSEWFEVAVEKLWKDLDSVRPLFNLISTLSDASDRSDIIAFRQPLRDVQWSRFTSYAHRFRSISWNDEMGNLSNEIFAQIFIHRPQGHILFPNIQAITWTAACDNTIVQILTLASSSLKSLHLKIEQGCSVESVVTTLKGLDDRGIRLNDLRIEAWLGADDIEITLASFLCDQLELKVVALPQYYGTKEIVTVLGSLPKLDAFHTTNYLPEVKNGMNWELGEGSIANLSSFGFNTPLAMANQILSSDSFSNLSRLSVTAPSSGAIDGGVHAFFVFVSSYCTGLHSLHLNLYQYPSDLNPITSSDFQPLFHLKSLEVLEVDDRKPVVGIDSQFVADMTHYWPSLRRLRLASGPTDPVEENRGTSFSILRAFAQHLDPAFKSLESIGLYFKVESERLVDTRGIDAFPALRELDVGISPIISDNVFSVATRLGGLCNPTLTIRAGRRSGQLDSNESQVVAVWGQAGASLRVLHTFQSPFRYELEGLESEAPKARAEVATWKRASSETDLASSQIYHRVGARSGGLQRRRDGSRNYLKYTETLDFPTLML
ncbi:hypothetical protein FRB97_008971 [Tulasnella sp. 331]|nr:hypothetical protein FRB97_008971 [Tulasnella sp. 331]KAG8877072.1 hypothetical protein FRB98_006918 [Tulasnella sp. 332]